MTLPIELLLAISLASQQVTENLLGPWVKKEYMRVAAIGITVGLTFAAWTIGMDGLEGLPAGKVAVLGVVAGLGSNVTHALLNRFAPSNKNNAVIGLLSKLKVEPPAPPSAGGGG